MAQEDFTPTLNRYHLPNRFVKSLLGVTLELSKYRWRVGTVCGTIQPCHFRTLRKNSGYVPGR